MRQNKKYSEGGERKGKAAKRVIRAGRNGTHTEKRRVIYIKNI